MDFVGNENDGTGGFDEDHAGFGGLTTAGLYELMGTGYNPDPSSDLKYPGWVIPDPGGPFLGTYPAEVVLLHIGTNDLNSSFNSQLVTNVQNSLNQIDAYSENVTVVLALIINRANGGTHTYTSQFNDAVDIMAQARIADGDKIIVLDMERDAGLIYNTSSDFVDSLHPSVSGYAKIGNHWLTGLELFMPRFTGPAIHDASDPLVATVGRPFEFSVTSDGAPPPTFSLVTPPDAGMAIDAGTGTFTWTPQDQNPDPVVVTVKAANLVPTGTTDLSLTESSDTRDFSIALNIAPVAVSDAYTTETDGTLSVTTATGLLANDSDADSDSLTTSLVSDVAHGTLSLSDDGSFAYTSDGSEATNDSFSYQANDGYADSSVVTVSITIEHSNNNNNGSSGGGGSGCFIDAIRPAVDATRQSVAWPFLLLLCCITHLHLKGRGGRSKPNRLQKPFERLHGCMFYRVKNNLFYKHSNGSGELL
jgi:VCBS repeat-containing protein